MKRYEELTLNEQKEFCEMLWSWLAGYTDTVINKVIAQRDDILANETAMFMLKELHLRKEQERKNHIRDLQSAIDMGREFERFTVLTHAGSYNEVLSDMYIRPDQQYSKKGGENE